MECVRALTFRTYKVHVYLLNRGHLILKMCVTGLGSSTGDQVLKYTKYPKHLPSTSTGQVLLFFKVLKYIKYFHIKYKYKYKYSY